MTHLNLTDSGESPAGRANRRHDGSWFARNWSAVFMLTIFVVGQITTGGAWVSGRENKERELAVQVEQLQAILDRAEKTYVRQDVLEQALRRIDEHLASIDAKVSREGRR